MKTIFIIMLILLSYSAYSQSFFVYDLDTTGFPNIKAKFFSLDANGKQITNLSPSDFEVKENGEKRVVSFVSCPAQPTPPPLSSVLVLDVSSSMSGEGLEIAQTAANAWIEMFPSNKSECAITSFSDKNQLLQDFTTNIGKLYAGINSLITQQGTNYNAALLDLPAGGLIIAKKGVNKRIIVFLTDGEPNFEPETDEIINTANDYNITIYCITLKMDAPQCLIDIATQTNGLYFENIDSKQEADECYRKILMISQGYSPCQIEWISKYSCVEAKTNLQILHNFKSQNFSYVTPSNAIAKVEFSTSIIKFSNAKPNMKIDTTISVTAINGDYNIINITSSNPSFTIEPTSFILNKDQTQVLKISFIPPDSGYISTKFTFINDLCPIIYYASGGYPGKKPIIKTLKLLHPNGGQIFVAGMDTTITWEGITPRDRIKIEYSTNNGEEWILIADTASGLSYNWKVPSTPSNLCLARVTTKAGYASSCPNGEIQICDEIWMSCNLNVKHYKNGDTIRYAPTRDEWHDANLKGEGAWCYYNNESNNGDIYGLLYNYYAVNDPRGLAPDNYHIATVREWNNFIFCTGGIDVAGGKLKETGTIEDGTGLWYSPNLGATNEYGFSALPGGYRNEYGDYFDIGHIGYWWAYSQSEAPIYSSFFKILSNFTVLYNFTAFSGWGFSVRCVSD